MRISQGENLLLEGGLLTRRDNVRRRVMPAGKRPEPVLEADLPWENGSAVFGTVFRDAGMFRMWYLGGGHVCYAESEDGLDWRKPELDLVILDGRRTNVLVQHGRFGKYAELFGVVKDETDPDPGRRYKIPHTDIPTRPVCPTA